MSLLLNVNILLPSRWDTHAKHEEVSTWLDTLLEFHTTSIVELGFMRISLSPARAATGENAHRSLTSLLSRHTHRFLPDDVSATDSPKSNYKDTTDAHLVRLAARHSLKLATLNMALVAKDGAKGCAINPIAIIQ